MSKIYLFIIALHLVISSDFVFASDPSAYEAAVYQIATDINISSHLHLGLGGHKRYKSRKMDELEGIAKACLGASALSELRTIRNEVEIAPYRQKIACIESKGGWYTSDCRLALNPKLNVGYISGCYYDSDFYFCQFKNTGHNCERISTMRLIKSAAKIRLLTYRELIEIRDAVSTRGLVVSCKTIEDTHFSHKTSGETLAIVDKHIKNYPEVEIQEERWESRKAWFTVVHQTKKIKASAGTSTTRLHKKPVL